MRVKSLGGSNPLSGKKLKRADRLLCASAPVASGDGRNKQGRFTWEARPFGRLRRPDSNPLSGKKLKRADMLACASAPVASGDGRNKEGRFT